MAILHHRQRRRRTTSARPAVLGLERRALLAITIDEIPLPFRDSRPAGITVGPDGNIWFAEAGQNVVPGPSAGSRIGRIAPETGTLAEFPVSSELAPISAVDITPGPDGNLWFTEGADNFIGRITPDGVATLFPFPQPTIGRIGPANNQITAGPDGALWFTDLAFPGNRNQVGRITTDGVATVFALPENVVPGGIVTGPDGNLWFTEDANCCGDSREGRIGRITPAGALTEFPIGFNYEPHSITVGPDGALWFTVAQSGRVGRITTAGDLTIFPLPDASSRPTGITLGPDGNLWFTEQDANKIGRITPSGVITEFAVPTPASGPFDIVAGPDRRLWFTELAIGKIGRVDLGLPPVPRIRAGSLDPASDSGASPTDGITNDTQPTFRGLATPGVTVRLFALRREGGEPFLVGQAPAASDGTWTITASAMLEGSYSIFAQPIGVDGEIGVTTQIIPGGPLGLLVIDPRPPFIAEVALEPRAGRLRIFYQDFPGGLDVTSLLNPTHYEVRPSAFHPNRPVAVTSVAAIPSGSPNALNVVVTLNGGRRLRHGRYPLTIRSGGVVDLAGNALDGEFSGRFATGDGRPGGDFVALLPTDGRRALPVEPIPSLSGPTSGQSTNARPRRFRPPILEARLGTK